MILDCGGGTVDIAVHEIDAQGTFFSLLLLLLFLVLFSIVVICLLCCVVYPLFITSFLMEVIPTSYLPLVEDPGGQHMWTITFSNY
jgi:hypothetical protein